MDEIGLKYLSGNATFYFFVSVGNYSGCVHDLALYLLLEKGISVVPGSAYGATVDRFIRVSIGTESEERIDYALQTLYDVINSKPVNSEWIRSEMQNIGLAEFSTGLT